MTVHLIEKIARALAPFFGKPFDDLPTTRIVRLGPFFYRHRAATQETLLSAAQAVLRVIEQNGLGGGNDTDTRTS